MSIKLMSAVWNSTYAKKTPARLLVMLKLADRADDEGGSCYEGQQKIADACGLARPTVNNVIKQLAADGKLEITHTRVQNRYQLHFDSLDVTVSRDDSQINTLSAEMTPTVSRDDFAVSAEMTQYISNTSDNHQIYVGEIFNFWKEAMNLNGKTMLTSERKKKIAARLKEGYTIDQIKSAILGCATSPFHSGQNDTKTKHQDIELICRNGSKLERFEQMWNERQTSQTLSAEEQEELRRREEIKKARDLYRPTRA